MRHLGIELRNSLLRHHIPLQLSQLLFWMLQKGEHIEHGVTDQFGSCPGAVRERGELAMQGARGIF